MSDIHALSGAYALDAVDDLERASFERHLAECETCQAEVASLRETAATMADDVAVAPPAELRSAVLSGISRIRPLPPETSLTHPDQPAQLAQPSRPAQPAPSSHAVRPADGGPAGPRRWFPALVAAVVLTVVGVGAAVWHPWTDQTSTTLSATDRVLHAADAQALTVNLPGGGAATIVRSETEHRAVMITKGVPQPPDGKVYQLWLQSPAQKMVSAGLMPDSQRPTLLSGDATEAIGAGLSLEPAGGSQEPTDVLATFAFSNKA